VKKLSIDTGTVTNEVNRPHVVIVGAGASLAAFPKGDKNGRRLPVIKNFVDVVGLRNLLTKHGISQPFDDFESIYSDIVAKPTQAVLQREIETIVNDYFRGLALPDEPTLYDHLILSLRPKDVIATFNWDPFLWQAAARNHHFGSCPSLLFLHGNVAIGYCPKCKIVFDKNRCCNKCGGGLKASPLLYPVKQKDYQADDAIAGHWRTLRRALEKAWAVTFFGYGAPKTDIEAVKLLKAGWGDVNNRSLEETEIIDVREEDDLLATWSPFIHTHHYQIQTSFYDSIIAKHPRRSCEALWARLMECQFLTDHSFPRSASFDELYAWLKPKLDEERA
jgi:hypothetical protein